MTLRAFLAGAFAALAGAAAVAAADGPGRTAPDPESTFVGSQTCRGCHATIHSSWTNGRHSRMLQEGGPKSVIPRFEGVALKPHTGQMEKPDIISANAEKLRQALAAMG